MQTKLTLRLEAALIEKAKRYGKKSGRSVSQMVADYFALLEQDVAEGNDAVTPIVASLRGSLREVEVDARAVQREILEKRL